MRPKLAIGIKEFAVVGHHLIYEYVQMHNVRAHARAGESVFARVIEIEREIYQSQVNIASAHKYEQCLIYAWITRCTCGF